MKRRLWRALGCALGAALALGMTGTASRAEPLRVGKPQSDVFSFVPLDIGIEEGIFAKHGVEVQSFDLGGAAKLQQALAAQAVDIGLGSGPALSFIAKGAPQLGIAAMAGPPLVMTLIVAKDGPIKSVADLKGETVSISSPGGVPEWMVRQLSQHEGWGPEGIKMIGLGADSAQVAALRTNQVVGMPNDIGLAMKLEDQGVARIMVHFGDIVPVFIMHVIFAGDDVIAKRPDELKKFLAGWFDTIVYMRAHKADVVRIGAAVTHVSPEIEGRVYDAVMPMFSETGRFDPKAVAILARSFVDLKLLPTEPDMSKLYTEKFLPSSVASK
ncbi:MAG TPA: ABC transporter substrate-binding protein [Stellaceae bacterium]|jgi:ABC-type nitrate/sulfonate/bicarbonate transport system substrate-binding protein